MQPHYQDDAVTLYNGDCLEVLRSLPDASVDAVVTDPPYGLEFMGKEWDSFKGEAWRNSAGMTGTGYTDGGKRLARPSFGGGDSANPTCATCGGRKRGAKKCACVSPEWRVKGAPLEQRKNNAAQMRAFGEWCELWTTECLRVLKPGGHLLAFGGSRTWHRLAVAVEDAGFEVRDSIAWLYGSGFPKSLDVSKAIDKAAGAERDGVRQVGPMLSGEFYHPKASGNRRCLVCDKWTSHCTCGKDAGPATDDARKWAGFGTALKPAFEPIVVARKPLVGTVAANVLAHGTGALNIDGCRVGTEPAFTDRPGRKRSGGIMGCDDGTRTTSGGAGRWPANVVLDESQAAALDQMSGDLGKITGGRPGTKGVGTYGKFTGLDRPAVQYPDSTGGASRFFPTFHYAPKAPTRERPKVDGVAHPTVKPLALMRWLVRLVTPPGGTVLEPFAGSGTTVEACVLEGFACIAIEREPDYLPLIQARLARVEAAQPEPTGPSLFDIEATA